jgi:hypothetical protein
MYLGPVGSDNEEVRRSCGRAGYDAACNAQALRELRRIGRQKGPKQITMWQDITNIDNLYLDKQGRKALKEQFNSIKDKYPGLDFNTFVAANRDAGRTNVQFGNPEGYAKYFNPETGEFLGNTDIRNIDNFMRFYRKQFPKQTKISATDVLDVYNKMPGGISNYERYANAGYFPYNQTVPSQRYGGLIRAQYGGDPSIPNLQSPVSMYKTGGWLDSYQPGGSVEENFVGPVDPRVGPFPEAPIQAPAQTPVSKNEYTGGSIVDFLNSKGLSSDKNSRREYAKRYGVEDYDFSANKNLELLSRLRGDDEIAALQTTPVVKKQVAPREKFVDKEAMNAISNIAMMSFTPNFGKQARKPFGFSGSMPRRPKVASSPKPEVLEGSPMDAPRQTTTGRLETAPEAFMPPTFDFLPVSSESTRPMFKGPYYNDEDMTEKVLSGKIRSVQPTDIFDDAGDFLEMGKNWVKRKIDLMTGDDPTKTMSKPKKQVVTKKPTTGVLETEFYKNPSIAVGDTIPDPDRGERFYHLPETIDLNTVRLGFRNRGGVGSTADTKGNTKTEGLIITPFAKEYMTGGNDDLGMNTIRRYNDSEIINDKVYGGVDDKGKFYLDYGKNLKGKNLSMADFDYVDVTGFIKDKSGKFKLGDETSNKAIAKVPHLRTADGKSKPLNFLVPKSGKDQEKTFGQTTGGRLILTTPDFKEKILVSGSLSDIDQEIENFKKKYNTKSVRIVRLDNGTFARGLRTKDKVLKRSDLKAYDNSNEMGGAGFYYYKSGGWLDNYK